MDCSQTEKVNIFSPELIWAPVLFILRKGGKNVILIEESNIERKTPMRRFLKFFARLFVLLLGLSLCISPLEGFAAYDFEYEQAVGNPLKGFMPFYKQGGAADSVPYSMEWFYVPLSALMSDSGEYTIREGIEPYLEEISARGNQAVFRVYLDYPGSSIGEKAVPQFIWDMGIKKEHYDEYDGGWCPDYSDGRLIDILCDFVRELAREYDGDRRIAYITTGLLGHWGEWHVCLPELEASKEQKAKIISAFAENFKTTRILTRYPGTPGTTRGGNVGFHDDSFTHSTLYGENWYFMSKMKKAHQTGVWKNQPIGGEFRPEGQSAFLSGAPLDGYQDYSECVNVTHCSWLMMAGAFEENLDADEIERAKTASAALGYDFTVTDARVMKIFGKIYAFVTIKNTGVAPIYYDLGVSFGVGNEKNAQWTKAENQKLCRLMPGKSAVFSAQISIDDGQSLFVRIEKPLENGKPIRFSNSSELQRADGSLELGNMMRF